MATPQSYNVLVGLNTPTTRYEAGDVASDIPAESVKWLLDGGYISSVDPSSSKKSAKSTDSTDTSSSANAAPQDVNPPATDSSATDQAATPPTDTPVTADQPATEAPATAESAAEAPVTPVLDAAAGQETIADAGKVGA